VIAANAPCASTWPGPAALAASSSKVTATTLATTAPATIASTVAAFFRLRQGDRFMCPASARRRTTRTQTRYDQVATFQPIRRASSSVRRRARRRRRRPPSDGADQEAVVRLERGGAGFRSARRGASGHRQG
jgi:hypothetical protein